VTEPAPGAIPVEAPDDALADAVLPVRGCTAAQLRRFIKSRPYVPLHELRRRFELPGEADDVSALETQQGTAYLGLPARECGLVQELLRQGEIGVELSVDPDAPVVVGVFAMRPVPRT
jgi:hypothetical protein